MDITIDTLIEEAEDIKNSLYAAKGSAYGGYYLPNNSKYEYWKNLSIRYLSANYTGDRCIEDFEHMTNIFELDHYEKKHMEALISILRSCKTIPSLPKIEHTATQLIDKSVHVSLSQQQTQNQTQEQKTAIDIFLEAIGDELLARQYNELREIAKAEPNPEKAKTKVLGKIKSWGGDVLANVVANIVTNPNIWNGLM